MKNKVKFLLVGGFIIIGLISIMYFTSKDTNKVDTRKYLPDKPMVKVFNGGYENGGYVHLIELAEANKIYMRFSNDGIGVSLIYHIAEDMIKCVYRQQDDMELLNTDLSKVKPNQDSIAFDANSHQKEKYRVTNKNYVLKTKIGELNCIELTRELNKNDIVKSYYAENIGLVRVVYVYNDKEIMSENIQFIDYNIDNYKTIESLDELKDKYN